MIKIKKLIVPLLCAAFIGANIAGSLKHSSKVIVNTPTSKANIITASTKVVNNSDKTNNGQPDVKRKETQVSDKAKIKDMTPFKVEVPDVDLEDLKETKQDLTVVDYTFVNTPESTQKQSNQDHRVETIYKGNGQRALMITQIEENMKPIDLLNDCEKITIKGVDAYIYNPQANIGISVIQIMFWKDGKYYNIMGRDIKLDKLIKIAESLK